MNIASEYMSFKICKSNSFVFSASLGATDKGWGNLLSIAVVSSIAVSNACSNKIISLGLGGEM